MISHNPGDCDRLLQTKIEVARQKGLLRQITALRPVAGERWRLADRELVSFSGNDYLGLGTEPASAETVTGLFGGAGASPLVRGYHTVTRHLEERIAAQRGFARCLVFPSGFQAGYGLISALVAQLDNALFLLDRNVHACLYEPFLRGAGQFKRYPHCDYAALARLLRSADDPARAVFVVTDGLFSMDGDIADLGAIDALRAIRPFTLVVDDAHGGGVLGDGGGIQRLWPDTIDILTGSLSKGYGTQGGYVCGSPVLTDFLVNFCRPYIYSTGISPLLSAAAHRALDKLAGESKEAVDGFSRLGRLRANIRLFLSGMPERLRALIPDFERRLAATDGYLSPVIPIILGPTAMEWAARARAAGIWVVAIRPPTVAPGTERLRVSISAAHTAQDIRMLLSFLEKEMA